MTKSTLRRFTSWGQVCNTNAAPVVHDSPPDKGTWARTEGGRGILAYGRGRSYGDVCMNGGGQMIPTASWTRIHLLDAATGLVECDSGVTLRELQPLALARGYTLPVAPGTGHVTIGGAIANDIHGKEQHREGNFGHHVKWLDLIVANGECLRISPSTHPELFRATVGGVGLTGLITRAAFQLKRMPVNAVVLEEVKYRDIEAIMHRMEAERHRCSHMVAWVDLLGPARAFGRGILELTTPAIASISAPPPAAVFEVPFRFPNVTLNRWSMRAFNELFWQRVPRDGRSRTVHLQRFLFPLDALHEWHRAYGRRGLFQFQFGVPAARAADAISAVGDVVRRSGLGSYLSVLKLVGQQGAGLLSFSRPGFSLAMDFPASIESRALISQLQQVVLKFDANVYLAKDACLHADEFSSMYPELGTFRSLLESIDPNRCFQSDMSRRLLIRGMA